MFSIVSRGLRWNDIRRPAAGPDNRKFLLVRLDRRENKRGRRVRGGTAKGARNCLGVVLARSDTRQDAGYYLRDGSSVAQRHVFNPTLRTNAVQMPCQEMRDLMPIRQTGVRFRSDEYCFRGGQIGQKLGECRQSSAINSARRAGVNRTNQALTRLLDHPGKFDCQLVKVGRDPPNAVTSESMDVRRGWACYSQHVQNIDEQLAVSIS